MLSFFVTLYFNLNVMSINEYINCNKTYIFIYKNGSIRQLDDE